MAAMNEESGFFSLEQGCFVHGDEHMRECFLCGNEFCCQCHHHTSICYDCTEIDEEDSEEDQSDFEDVGKLNALLGDDEDVEQFLEESDEIPPEDMMGLDN